jgi:hypothetical protein
MSLQRRVVAGGNVFGAWTVEDTGTIGVGSTYLYKLANNIISTDVTRDAASGAYSVSIEHVEDTQALQTFIESASNTGAGAIEDLLLEDSTNETGSAQNKKLIVAVRGGLVGGGNETNTAFRKVGVFPQRLSNESGGWTQAGETYNRVTLSFEGFKLQNPITLAATYFTDFMTSAVPVTLFGTIPYGTVVYK